MRLGRRRSRMRDGGIARGFCAPLLQQFFGKVAARLTLPEEAAEAMCHVCRLAHDKALVFLVDVDYEQVAGLQVEAPADVRGQHEATAIADVGCEPLVGHMKSVAHAFISRKSAAIATTLQPSARKAGRPQRISFVKRDYGGPADERVPGRGLLFVAARVARERWSR